MTPHELLHSEISNSALLFAQWARYGQTRKIPGGTEPHYRHLQRVAIAVAYSGKADQDMVTAAYLHDVLEDCQIIDLSEVIDSCYGATVYSYVRSLTGWYTPNTKPWNRSLRKALEAERLGRQSWQVRLIKRADISDNLRRIDALDPAFVPVYQKELAHLTAVLDEADAKEGVDSHL